MFFAMMVIAYGGALVLLDPGIMDLAVGFWMTEGIMYIIHRYMWHDPYGIFPWAQRSHAEHHLQPTNEQFDAQDLMAWLSGGIIFCVISILCGSAVASGAFVHHLAAMVVHDEGAHGRMKFTGLLKRSVHVQKHHGNPSSHFSIIWEEL